ncbi:MULTISPECIES: methionyl-tRNA formyltransferase [unclassified Nitratiruptor]|uniref:methionyl-tRNA formyltransferase n=1 Tax=unclassified Nitratiruptor TaxID=2624044 RepID=UPI0019161CAB|nr:MULTISPECIES: methionyl-tRNA formyltransferase [unclassified Nitratiruptor]BCD60048.1 methionyl-tRNA formyltransferase [Nitratiruptor sp. YY08-10]BCD64463.1 methionyl-tRNA formyltransferase [Nitratiruptor sp. YY08-14]
MRIVFMGTPDYATTILDGLLEKFEVVGVFTQPDKPVGRKQVVTPPHVKKFLIEKNIDIPIFQPISLKRKEVYEQLRTLAPDFIVVAAYGQILPKEILQMAPCINLHASLLPKYRGASPIQHALLNGDTVTGVTAMLMDEGLDTGDILAYDVINIQNCDNAITLFEKLSHLAKELTPKVLQSFESIAPIAQHDVDASYCKKIRKQDGLIRFDDAKVIWNKYRAFLVWPGIFLENGLKLIEIVLVETQHPHEEGKILEISDAGVVVGCKRGSICIKSVQPPSKKAMKAVAYLRGKRLNIGDTFF